MLAFSVPSASMTTRTSRSQTGMGLSWVQAMKSRSCAPYRQNGTSSARVHGTTPRTSRMCTTFGRLAPSVGGRTRACTPLECEGAVRDFFGYSALFAELLHLQVTVSDRLPGSEYSKAVAVTLTPVAPIAGGTNIQLLEKIVSDQRGLLQEVFNTTDVTTIPQVWTLCKFCSSYVLLPISLMWS